MRTIIAGSRSITELSVVARAVAAAGWTPTVVLSGTARGVDALGEVWAWQNGVAVERYPANWKQHGRVAGFLRNGEMARNAEALIAVWDGVSPGTRNMIDQASKQGLRIFIFNTREART